MWKRREKEKRTHETSGEGAVSADDVVNLDETLHKNELDLAGGEGISETVTKNDDEGKALTTLVGTRGRLGSPGAAELGKHPVAGSVQSLQVFLGSARL